jgi:hypothetical protein
MSPSNTCAFIGRLVFAIPIRLSGIIIDVVFLTSLYLPVSKVRFSEETTFNESTTLHTARATKSNASYPLIRAQLYHSFSRFIAPPSILPCRPLRRWSHFGRDGEFRFVFRSSDLLVVIAETFCSIPLFLFTCAGVCLVFLVGSLFRKRPSCHCRFSAWCGSHESHDAFHSDEVEVRRHL